MSELGNAEVEDFDDTVVSDKEVVVGDVALHDLERPAVGVDAMSDASTTNAASDRCSPDRCPLRVGARRPTLRVGASP